MCDPFFFETYYQQQQKKLFLRGLISESALALSLEPSVTTLFNFFCYVARGIGVSRKELFGELLRAKESGKYKEDACQAFTDWFIFSPKPRPPWLIPIIPFYPSDDDYDDLRNQFKTLAEDEDFKRLCLHLHSLDKHYNSEESPSKISVRSLVKLSRTYQDLFNFFCALAAETESGEALIGRLLRARQSGKYKEDACQAFSDWLIFSPKPRPRPTGNYFFQLVNPTDNYYFLRDKFMTRAENEDFKRLCLDLQSWYMDDEESSSNISIRSLDGDLLHLDKSAARAESGVLKGLADSIQEGLVVDGDGVIPVPNISTYVLSQVILFLEKKQHFQENVNKAAAHYEGWSTAFFNRNSHILPDLQQAAETLEIPSLKESVNKELNRKDGRHLNDNLSSEMFHYFSGMVGNNKRSGAILEELNNIKLFSGLDKGACENFRKWFTHQVRDSGKDHHNEFKTLMKSPDFSQVCLSLYRGSERLHFAQISLRSHEGEVLKIDKFVAVEESMFLRRCVNRSGFWEEIPVSTSSIVLSSAIDFCCKVWDFRKIYGSHRIKEGLVVVDHFRDWTTEFLKRNIDKLSELYEAADFLEIPSLLLLTTEEVTDLVTRPLDKASVLSGKLSFSRMLSSLFVRFTE